MCFIVATKRPAQAFAVSYLIVYSFILPFIFIVCRLFAPCLIGAGRSGFFLVLTVVEAAAVYGLYVILFYYNRVFIYRFDGIGL